MAYYVFNNIENLEGTLFRISENLNYLNTIIPINLQKSYKIIEDNSVDFNLVRKHLKKPIKFVNNEVVFINKDQEHEYDSIAMIQTEIDNIKKLIKPFIDNNKQHSLYSIWNNFYGQLSNLNVNGITIPTKLTTGEIFNSLNPGNTYLNVLELPQ
jgi:hypothetical protein